MQTYETFERKTITPQYMKSIIIGGCSFSQRQGYDNSRWIPYGDTMISDFPHMKIHNVAKSSNSNASIMKQMIEHIETNDNTFDFAIVQLSAFGRAMVKEEDVIQKLIETNQHHLLPETEYFIGKQYGLDSILSIIALKNYLENKGIKYKMFWGWKQVMDDTYDNLLKGLYNENFWLYGEHGGMSEWILDNVGDDGLLECGHPSTKGHQHFYKNIILKWINTNTLI